jgi:hypothetical protein
VTHLSRSADAAQNPETAHLHGIAPVGVLSQLRVPLSFVADGGVRPALFLVRQTNTSNEAIDAL